MLSRRCGSGRAVLAQLRASRLDAATQCACFGRPPFTAFSGSRADMVGASGGSRKDGGHGKGDLPGERTEVVKIASARVGCTPVSRSRQLRTRSASAQRLVADLTHGIAVLARSRHACHAIERPEHLSALEPAKVR